VICLTALSIITTAAGPQGEEGGGHFRVWQIPDQCPKGAGGPQSGQRGKGQRAGEATHPIPGLHVPEDGRQRFDAVVAGQEIRTEPRRRTEEMKQQQTTTHAILLNQTLNNN
jgi:hypothetical protein